MDQYMSSDLQTISHKEKKANEKTLQFYKRNVLICTIFLFLMVLVFLFVSLVICIPTPLKDERYPLFFVERNGFLYDISHANDDNNRRTMSSSLDTRSGITRPVPPILSETPTTITKLTWNNNKDTRGYSVDTIDKQSHEILLTTVLFETQGQQKVPDFVYSPSNEMLLFADIDFSYQGTNECRHTNYFWFIKQDSRWTKIPIDFGLKKSFSVLGWEILSEYSRMYFLFYVEEEKKNYISIYNLKEHSFCNTVPITQDLYGPDVRFRILNGGNKLFVYNLEPVYTPKSLNGVFLMANELTVIKKVHLPNVSMGYELDGNLVTASPNLRYIAIGGKAVILFDIEKNSLFIVEKFESLFWYRLLFNPRINQKAVLHSFTSLFSISFSEDSHTLTATNLLGDIFQWDVERKKRIRKITSIK